MAEQTTSDGLTVEQIDNAYEVLEILRENLSDDGMDNLSQIVNEAHYLVQQYDEGADWSQTYDLPDVGDELVDTEANPKFGDGRVEVTDVLHKESRLHYVDVNTGRRSVAYMNPSHPADAPVVMARYIEGSDKEYAFPCTRLSKPWP